MIISNRVGARRLSTWKIRRFYSFMFLDCHNVVDGYDPIKMLESLLNALIRKGILSRAEADQVVNAARVPERV